MTEKRILFDKFEFPKIRGLEYLLDEDGNPDILQIDENSNGIADVLEIDANGDGIPDAAIILVYLETAQQQ